MHRHTVTILIASSLPHLPQVRHHVIPLLELSTGLAPYTDVIEDQTLLSHTDMEAVEGEERILDKTVLSFQK